MEIEILEDILKDNLLVDLTALTDLEILSDIERHNLFD